MNILESGGLLSGPGEVPEGIGVCLARLGWESGLTCRLCGSSSLGKEVTAKWTLTKNIFWESCSWVLSSLGLSCHFSGPRNPFFTFLLPNLNSFILFLPVFFFFFLLLFIDSISTLAPASTLCCFTTLENKEWKRIYKVLEKQAVLFYFLPLLMWGRVVTCRGVQSFLVNAFPFLGLALNQAGGEGRTEGMTSILGEIITVRDAALQKLLCRCTQISFWITLECKYPEVRDGIFLDV